MVGAGLRLLDAGYVLRARHHDVVGKALRAHPSPVVSDHRDCQQPTAAGLAERLDHVAGVARRGQREQRVAAQAVGDHLPGEDRIHADVVRDRGQDPGVLGEVYRRPAAARGSRSAEVGDGVHRVGGRTAVAEREQLASVLEAGAQILGRAHQHVAIVGERLCAQRADIACLQQGRARDVLDDGLELALALGQERVQEARGAGVVHLAGVSAREQAAVLEEDVHELPEHVIERLHELLAHVRVGARRLELPLRAELREGDRQASARTRERDRASHFAGILARLDEHHHDVLLAGDRDELGRRLSAGLRQRDRGQRTLADDHRVHELHGDVTRIRARRRRDPERDQLPPAREALGHLVAQAREALGLELEELAVGGGTPLEQRGQARAQGILGGGERQAGAPARARATSPSHSRQASIPSPVRALSSIRSAPGFTWSTL